PAIEQHRQHRRGKTRVRQHRDGGRGLVLGPYLPKLAVFVRGGDDEGAGTGHAHPAGRGGGGGRARRVIVAGKRGDGASDVVIEGREGIAPGDAVDELERAGGRGELETSEELVGESVVIGRQVRPHRIARVHISSCRRSAVSEVVRTACPPAQARA